MNKGERKPSDTTDSSKDDSSTPPDGILDAVDKMSLNSIPSIDRSDDESSSPLSSNPSNLEHKSNAPAPPNLAHTPPPEPTCISVPNLAHTPPPPPAPEVGLVGQSFLVQRTSPRPSSVPASQPFDSPGDTYATIPGSSDPSTPDTRQPICPPVQKRCSLDAVVPDPTAYIIGSSPPSISGYYGPHAGLYNSSHPSSGIYSGSASLGSLYGSSEPPPVPPPPLENLEFRKDMHHRREHSFNSIHSVNSLREFYDKSSLNRFISTSPKLSNRDMEMNRMSNLYGSLASAGGDYTGLTEVFTDPVEEEGGERVVWEYHNVHLTRVASYGFGIAVSGGRDNPHFRNGDPAIAISDVIKGGPAEGKLEVNDRLISANGISLENVDYARAVQVLRESGQSVHLVVKRRIVLPATPEPQTVKVTLSKTKKKEDYGIVLGCRIYVKEILNRSIADKDGLLREGDVLLKINNSSTENLSVKEARKILDGTKDRLQLLVRRENAIYSPQMSPDLSTKDVRNSDFPDTRHNYPAQNLYVQPPTRLPDNLRNHSYQDLEAKSNLRRPDARFVSFKKEGSVGIRLTGGNDVGIFVTAVQPKSQAQLQGLIPGDKILKVNDMDMTGVTREEAVLYLMSLQDQIDLIVQTCLTDYQHILSTQKGDLFYIRTHFHFEPNGRSELSFRSGDIFRVIDTLHNGVVGAWQVNRIGRNNQETQKGIIPNKARAEELATAQFNAAKKEQTQSESRSGFFKRRRNSRRSKSLGKDHWEDVVFADSVSKFPAYERVALRHPGFIRPVVLFGPLADVARDRLLKEDPGKYASPQLDSSGEKPSGIIRLSAIREILERGKHAVLDITPNAVDRLNYAQFYPIVIFLRAESKQGVKELRSGMPKQSMSDSVTSTRGRMSSKKLFDQSVKLEKLWSHVFTATVNLNQPDTWYKKMKELLDKQQNSPIWMSEAKPSETLTDDFLFPMTSRLSYASSPESDLETGPESRTPSKSPNRSSTSQSGHSDIRDSRGRLMKSSSDPSIAAQEEDTAPISQPGPPPYTLSPSRMPPPPGPDVKDGRRKSQGGDSKYGFSSSSHSSHYQANDGPYPGGGRPPPNNLSSNGFRDDGKEEKEELSPDGSKVQKHPYTPVPAYSNSRSPQGLSLPPNALPSHSPQVPHSPHSPHSPNLPQHLRHSPYSHPGRSPLKVAPNYSSHQEVANFPPPQYNGLGNCPMPIAPPDAQQRSMGKYPSSGDGPELPPKVDRTIKPGKMRSPSQERQGVQEGNHRENEIDNNYINTVRGGNLEHQNKSPYDISGIPLGPNAHDDLKSRLNPRSHHDHYRYNRLSSQPHNYTVDDPYSRTDFNKPMPPPKGGGGGNYKPVPPPKPKNYRGPPEAGGGGIPNWGGSGYGDIRKGYDRGAYHTSSNGGLSDDYSGLDSGQGSSLDRKCDTFGRSTGKVVNSSSSRGGYYLNVPPPRGANTRDLPNHDHKGSAFELYKKPADPRNAAFMQANQYPAGLVQSGMPAGQLPSYLDQGSRCSSMGTEEKERNIVATAKGVFDHRGGILTSEETGVSIVIPEGALPSGKTQEIYFKVCQDSALVPPLDHEKGETLLSPLVMCGPHGLEFKRPVELRLPHAASVSPNTWSFALKSTEAANGPQSASEWTNVALASEAQTAKISQNSVSVLVDHF